jgi:hypothetical protein
VPIDLTYAPEGVDDYVIVHRPGQPVDSWRVATADASRKAYEVFAPDDDQGSLALSSARGDDAAQQAEADDDEDASQEEVALAPETEHARPDDAAQQPATEDDEEASQEQVALASDPEHARSYDAARQPETDDDEEASQEEVALAPDTEVARTEGAAQQLKTDDDEEASQERAALVSDNEDAATDGAGVMETAKAGEAGVDSTGDDDAAAAPGQPVAPASVNMEEGFSFATFAKPGVPVEIEKEAMPAEQFSPEDSPGSGVPGSESALPDPGSKDVGNAAPSKEPVVHHGDLAP